MWGVRTGYCGLLLLRCRMMTRTTDGNEAHHGQAAKPRFTSHRLVSSWWCVDNVPIYFWTPLCNVAAPVAANTNAWTRFQECNC